MYGLLVLIPNNHTIIRTRWVFRNKLNKHGTIVRNKVKLVAKGYNQEEGIDYNETFAPIVRLEAICMLLAFAYVRNFKLFQMDVKSVFLNGYIMEKVCVQQLLCFEDNLYPNHV